MSASRRWLAAVAIGLSGLALVSCAGSENEQTTETVSTATETVAAPLEYDPNGGAEGNKAYFDQVMTDLIKKEPKAGPKLIVDTLVEAGFDKSAMEVTSDVTPTGLEAAFVIVSVKMPDGMCLLGQRGMDAEYASLVKEPISTGTCQVGEGIDIDW